MDEIQRIGCFYTPLEWAMWLIKRHGIYDAWINGATICDPTAGEGVFAIALFKIAKDENRSITPEMLERLCLVEIDAAAMDAFIMNAKCQFGIAFPEQCIVCTDVIKNPPDRKFDILMGNPPWVNFTDLPMPYREEMKEHYINSGLVRNRQDVMLGGTRIDFSALVLCKAMGTMLKQNGRAFFFLPLSLFCGDRAHDTFREFQAMGRKFAVTEVYEFQNRNEIFKSVFVQYCAAAFQLDVPHTFPVPYFKYAKKAETMFYAWPLNASNTQWQFSPTDKKPSQLKPILRLPQKQQPRQGVNTCGARSIFVFNEYPDFLPSEFLYPLATSQNWQQDNATPQRWILLPYNRKTGRPFTDKELAVRPVLKEYLLSHKEALLTRSGIILRDSISRGFWWSMLGVGAYSFTPYKVIWEALGKRNFSPIILSSIDGQPWQGNQAMHAFIPCPTLKKAQKVLAALKKAPITRILKETNSTDRQNWAQPGKIAKLLEFY